MTTHHDHTSHTKGLNDALGEQGGSHIFIFPPSYDNIPQGTVQFTSNSSQVGCILFWNNSDTDGDNVIFKTILSKGTYSLAFLYVQASYGGIAKIDLDGALVLTQDTYLNITQFNLRAIATGIVVSESGFKDIRVRVDGKHASSTGYSITWAGIMLWRTA